MSRRLLVTAASLAALLALGLAPVASAVDAADYVLWRVWSSGHKAIVLLEDTNAGARVSAAIKGLDDGTTYQIVGTDVNGGCAQPVVSGVNTTFDLTVLGNTQANGTFVVGHVTGDDWKDTRFIRIREQGGGVWACRTTSAYSGGVTVAQGAIARFASQGELHGLVLVEKLANGRERLSVALGDVNGDGADDVIVRGSPKACGKPVGTVAFGLKLENVLFSSFKSTTMDLTQSKLDGLKSIRVKKLTGDSGRDWFPACHESILIALLLP